MLSTLSFYPELPSDRLRELSRTRFNEPVTIDSIQAYRAIDLTRTQKVLDVRITGTSST